MAPLPTIDYTLIPDLRISSLELDRRFSPADLPTYLSSLSLSDRESLNPSSLFKRTTTPADVSPRDLGTLLRKKDASPTPQAGLDPSAGSIPPDAINNKGVLALFALIGLGLVLSSIWFFFWAKNGGFVFRQGDWEEYKSTVLRRKGPNGTTLSGATKTTELGGGSVVGSEGSLSLDGEVAYVKATEKARGGRGAKRGKNGKKLPDADLRAYRHEKPALVGGLNRESDATYTDFTATDPSEQGYAPAPYTPSPKKAATPKQRYPSYTPNSESAFSLASNDSHRPLRPANTSPTRPHFHNHTHNTHAQPRYASPAHTPSPSRSRHPSPTKPHHASTPRARAPSSHRHSNHSSSYTEPIDFASRYTASEAETEESRGTKSYFHPLPGLSGRDGRGGGFRRGGGGRRDSLSDSEGEV